MGLAPNEPSKVVLSVTEKGISIEYAPDNDVQVIDLILGILDDFDGFQQIIWGDGCRKIAVKTPQYPFEQNPLFLTVDSATKEQISQMVGYFWAKLYRQNLSPKLVNDDGTIYIGDGGF
jgi:hypothetical protein